MSDSTRDQRPPESCEEAGRTEESFLMWAMTPTGYLDHARLVDLLDDPTRFVDAARQAFDVVR